MKYTATDYLGNEFEYEHDVIIEPPNRFAIWSYNEFRAKALDDKWYIVKVQGVFDDSHQKYINSLAQTKEWFIEQLKMSGGVLTKEMMEINRYGWIPAAYAQHGRKLTVTPYFGKPKRNRTQSND